MLEKFLENTLNDIRVDIADEFDQNFERKGFFSEKWKDAKRNRRGSLMLRTGKLRRSIRSQLTPAKLIRFSSSLPYASIHNDGGKIKVTAKMKAYFWALYREATAGLIYSVKTKAARKTARNVRLTEDATFNKAMALKKVGESLTIPKRQFIGWHSSQDASVERAINNNLNELNAEIRKALTPR